MDRGRARAEERLVSIPALQRVLGAEHAAVYVLSTLAAQTSQTQQPEIFAALLAAYDVHVEQRDWLVARISRTGAQPVASATAYEVPPATTTTALVAAALDLERRATRVYATAVAGVQDADRRWLVDALSAGAVRLLRFRGSPEILPGTAS